MSCFPQFGLSNQLEQSESLESCTYPPKGVQVYENVPVDQTTVDGVGRPVIHKSAYQQATGEAVYIDDIPTRKGQI